MAKAAKIPELPQGVAARLEHLQIEVERLQAIYARERDRADAAEKELRHVREEMKVARQQRDDSSTALAHAHTAQARLQGYIDCVCEMADRAQGKPPKVHVPTNGPHIGTDYANPHLREPHWLEPHWRRR